MEQYDIAVIGGGAAGIVAAICSARKGARVVLCEKMPRLGKKILASGAGRCNLSNERLDPAFYNPESRALVKSVFERFGQSSIERFFRELGLVGHSDNGRIFPASNQASSVVSVLEMEIKRLRISCKFHCDIGGLSASGDGFVLRTKLREVFPCRKAVLCGGGKSYPALGADGSGYLLARHFGHRIIEPVPSTVPLLAKDSWCHTLQGQKIRAAVYGFAGGRETGKASGEVLFTKYGLSGTAILDVSEELSIAIHRNGEKDIFVSVDLIPFMEENELRDELSGRLRRGFEKKDLVTGILPGKFSAALERELRELDVPGLANFLKNRRFKIVGTRGWNEAEFTAGGIDTDEVVAETLESKRRKGLYLAGEILNVQGRRGGYNLAWAWASGWTAGAAAAG
ncbi:MAG TPA: aminoacetone oxidase family FAD-binding enzyme [Candidatus Omnitrophota bacterium]|nr:aminoacetone oxidase family FAD-binding enzyme [Candidatus Omnitrophota bacterium]